MDFIINITDFFDGGELNVPGTDTDPIQEKLNDFIGKYEEDYLQRSLGYPLWKACKADGYPTPGTDKFKNLINGNLEFTDCNGRLKLWPGFKITNANPIADYIWYWLSRDNASFSTVIGEVKGSSENATSVSVTVKQMRAWNEMVKATHLLWDFLKANADIYTEFDRRDVNHKIFQPINSLNL